MVEVEMSPIFIAACAGELVAMADNREKLLEEIMDEVSNYDAPIMIYECELVGTIKTESRFVPIK